MEGKGDLLFNKAPVIKDAKGTKKPKKVKKQSVFQDKDEDSLDQVEKHVKTDNPFADEDTYFSKMNQNLMTYFTENKNTIKNEEKMS